jgi:hypothetical protein
MKVYPLILLPSLIIGCAHVNKEQAGMVGDDLTQVVEFGSRFNDFYLLTRHAETIWSKNQESLLLLNAMEAAFVAVYSEGDLGVLKDQHDLAVLRLRKAWVQHRLGLDAEALTTFRQVSTRWGLGKVPDWDAVSTLIVDINKIRRDLILF